MWRQFFSVAIIFSVMKKNSVVENLSRILPIVALICIMLFGYIVMRHKKHFREAYNLPYYEVKLEDLADGEYYGKTYTSFLHVQLNVKIQNHKISEIEVIENSGIDGETAKPVLQRMIEQNSVVVPAEKHAELGSLVYISCVSCALAENEE